MLQISNKTSIPMSEIEMTAIRSSGAGGQNVNKVASAIQLRFDINASSMSPIHKSRLLKMRDRRISKDGVIVIKAQTHRSQEQNREDALKRLQKLLKSATITRPKRKPTKPSRSAKRKRVDKKKQRGKLKASRKNVKMPD